MVPTEGTNWASNDLELLPSLARCLPGLVVWYGLNVATFGGFSCSKRSCISLSPLSHPSPSSHPPAPLFRWTEISAHQKKCLKSPEIQPSAIHRVNYTKSNGLLYLLQLLIHDGQLQAAGCFN